MKEYQENHIKMWKAFKEKVKNTNCHDLPEYVSDLKEVIIKDMFDDKHIDYSCGNCFLCKEAVARKDYVLSSKNACSTVRCVYCPSKEFRVNQCDFSGSLYEEICGQYDFYISTGGREGLGNLFTLIDKMINIECSDEINV